MLLTLLTLLRLLRLCLLRVFLIVGHHGITTVFLLVIFIGCSAFVVGEGHLNEVVMQRLSEIMRQRLSGNKKATNRRERGWTLQTEDRTCRDVNRIEQRR
jgi:hypothetical protein